MKIKAMMCCDLILNKAKEVFCYKGVQQYESIEMKAYKVTGNSNKLTIEKEISAHIFGCIAVFIH